jgi:serine/threonine protein kinase
MQGSLESAAGVRAGDVLAGKFRIDRVLGMGGMGVVVEAYHLQLETKVAIKFLLPATLEDHEAVERFAREARAAVKITSEHVARVLDVGTLEETGAPYIVMEFLEGSDLATLLQERGPLAIEMTVDFVLQACVAIADAHRLGIVHRDLKPGNLFCVPRSDGGLVIKVLDFGISKLSGLGGLSGIAATRTNAVMGSPLYMSPEQMISTKDVDAQTDIWALGVILYELLTGARPFVGSTYAEIAIRVATAAPPSLRSLRADIPEALDAAVLRCLEKDKRARYANVAELALALADFGPPHSRIVVDRISGILDMTGRPFGASGRPAGPSARPAVVPSAGTLPSKPSASGTMTSLPPAAASGMGSIQTAPPTAATAAQRANEPPRKNESTRRLMTLGVVAGVVSLMAVGGWVVGRKSPSPGNGAGGDTTGPPPSVQGPATQTPDASPSGQVAAGVGDVADSAPTSSGSSSSGTPQGAGSGRTLGGHRGSQTEGSGRPVFHSSGSSQGNPLNMGLQ